MADADKSLKTSIDTDASQAISEQERYNKKLQEMAVRTQEAAQATRELADAEALASLKAEALAKQNEKLAAGNELARYNETLERMAGNQAMAARTARELADAQAAAFADARVSGPANWSKELYEMGNAGGEAGQKIKNASDEATLSLSEQKKLINQLSHAFPELGWVARAALNPVTAGASLSILLFAQAKKSLAEYNAELDALGERAATVGWNLKEAFAEVERINQFKFDPEANGLNAMAKAQKSFKDDLTATLEAMRRQDEILAARDDAAKGAAIAKINLAEAEGKMTPAQALQAKAGVNTAFEARKAQREVDAKMQEKAAADEEAARLSNAANNLEFTRLKPLQAEQDKRRALIGEQGLPAQISTEADQLKGMNKEQEAARKQYEKDKKDIAHLESVRRSIGADLDQSGFFWTAESRQRRRIASFESKDVEIGERKSALDESRDRLARLQGDEEEQKDIEGRVRSLRESAVGPRRAGDAAAADASKIATIANERIGSQQYEGYAAALVKSITERDQLLGSISQASQITPALRTAIVKFNAEIEELQRIVKALEQRGANTSTNGAFN